jgi:hypothetical protein
VRLGKLIQYNELILAKMKIKSLLSIVCRNNNPIRM